MNDSDVTIRFVKNACYLIVWGVLKTDWLNMNNDDMKIINDSLTRKFGDLGLDVSSVVLVQAARPGVIGAYYTDDLWDEAVSEDPT